HHLYFQFVYPIQKAVSLGVGSELIYTDNKNHIEKYYFSGGLGLNKFIGLGITGKAVTGTKNGNYGENMGLDLGFYAKPLKWLDSGISVKNLNQPSIKYKDSGDADTLDREITGGVSLSYKEYLRFIVDLTVDNLAEQPKDIKYTDSYGIEVYPLKYAPVRAGVRNNEWSIGIGLISEKINFDYCYVKNEQGVHYIQYMYKFGLPMPRRKEMLDEKEAKLKKDSLFNKGLRHFNMGEIAQAKKKADEYIKKYGNDEKISALVQNIQNWLNMQRKEKLGRAKELQKEILKDYYHGKIEQAFVKLENAELLAPNYEEIKYLRHLLNARVLLEEGEYKQAEQELVKALKFNPDSKEVKNLHNRLLEVMNLSEEE
ncbi:MAG: tetratricopeptide repeat protein, partial [Elusimicrobiota bacterium]